MKPSYSRSLHLSLSISLLLAFILFFIFILPLVACPLWGQELQKKQLTASDYAGFGELKTGKISSSGKWLSFQMIYKNGMDTLFVKSTLSDKKYFFAGASPREFMQDDAFIYKNNKDLELFDLNSGENQILGPVLHFSYSPYYNLLVILTDFPKQKKIKILDRKGRLISQIDNALDFKMSPCGRKILFTAKKQHQYQISILDLCHPNVTETIIEKSEAGFDMLTWEQSGKSAAFSKSGKNNQYRKLYYYLVKQKKTFELDPESHPNLPLGIAIDSTGRYPLEINFDSDRVFFGVYPKNSKLSNSKETVEIWNGNAPWIPVKDRIMGRFDSRPKLASWMPHKNAFLQISTDELPKAMLCGNGRFALISNPKSHEPQFDYDGPRDFYILDLNTGQKELLLYKKQMTAVETPPLASPCGKYISYFKDGHWWVYDINTKKHVNVTLKTSINLVGHVESLYRNSPFGTAGWTPNDKEIIIYDEFDLWLIKPDGSSYTRITKGREKQIRFRISQIEPSGGFANNYDGFSSTTISAVNTLFLKAQGEDGKTGYFLWQKNKGEKPIVFDDAGNSRIIPFDNYKSFIYLRQNFDKSPSLILQKGKNRDILQQSNPDQKKYHWGKSELVHYKNSKGKALKGVLYYPAEFDSAKKYPMIVHVYEIQSQKLHTYQNPTLQNESGYNLSVLTSQGYFVLYPDIIAEEKNEGSSSLDCTVSAVKMVLSLGFIKPDKVGLIGHSFGGYETDFIISQTGIFAAAVAGSAITDISSYYLSINWKTGRPTMNYFQNDHFKMVQSPYEIPEIYSRNSPIIHAEKINTPLLSYTGKKDEHVPWLQSVELYLAMRRLGKKHIMLLYEDEGHSINIPENQIDLTNKITDWFAYYLKDEKNIPWIKQGVE